MGSSSSQRAGAPQLVLFDCDGVLVDSERISNDVLAQMLSAEGLTMRMPQSRATFQGMLLADIRALAQQLLGRSLPSDWIERYERERDAAFRLDLQPVPGAAAAVSAVRAAGIPVCVASQGKLEKTELSLTLTGLAPLFPVDTRFSAYTVARGKPHPDLFLHAAATMGADPSACTVVEDTPSGVTAAIAAGMRAVGYAADSNAAALQDAGAELFYSHDELPRLLGLISV
ncbi:MAG TPA: HAD family phosphatase [Solirubrobacteraceae bacterium]